MLTYFITTQLYILQGMLEMQEKEEEEEEVIC